MKTINRRSMLGLLGSVPLAAGFTWTDAEAADAAHAMQEARKAPATGVKPAFKPKFFTAREYAMVRVLVDTIIPKDARSGSATDAGVPEFMDFMMVDQPRSQTAMRGGLAAIDRLCEERFDKRFLACSAQERRAVLDDIAFPAKATPATSQVVAFFSSFRDLTASGFWTSKMGVDDLGYDGNTFVAQWKGCPEEALKKLGVSYEAD